MTLQVQGQSTNIVYNTTASAATSGSADVSVFNKKQPQTAYQQNNGEKERLIKSFEEKLDKLLTNYSGITKEELRKIAKEAGFEKRDGDTLTEEKVEKMLKYIQEALDKSSEIDENGNKVVNKDKLKQYYQESYKKILESVKKGLGGILEKYLPAGKNILNASDDELKAAVEKFLLESIKAMKGKKLTPEQMKQQQNEFKALLAATPDELKVKIWDAAKSLLSENGQIKEAITEMIKSFVTPENLQNFLHKISQEDLKKLGINIEDLTQAVEKAAKEGNPEALVDLMDSLVKLVEDFYKNNNETIGRCRSKIAEYKKQNNIAEDKNLTDEQLKEVLSEDYETYKSLKNLEAMFSGGSVGAMEQDVDVQPWYRNLKEQGINMDDIYTQMKDFIEAHKDELNLTPKQFRDILNKATDNAYGKVTGDVSPDTNVTENNAPKTAEPDYGIVQRMGEDAYYTALNNAEKIKQSFAQDDKPEKIVVEKSEPKSNVYTMDAYRKGFIKIPDLVKHIKDMCSYDQRQLAEDITRSNNKMKIIGGNNLFALIVGAVEPYTRDEIRLFCENGGSGIVANILPKKENNSEYKNSVRNIG